MRVLHVDLERGWRGGQIQLQHLASAGDAEICRSAPSFFRALRRFRPDLVAAHSARSHQLALLQSRPVVVHRRVDFPIRRRARWKYRRAARIVAVSEAVRDVVVQGGVEPERVEVVFDGIAPPSLPPVPERPVVLTLGALVPHKGHAVLVEAARRGGFAVTIAGEGPLRADLERRARGTAVRLVGYVRDPWLLLTGAAVYCQPSLEEGLGQAVLEARAAGCRLVATRAGGIPEAAGPGALLVPPGDPDALAHAIALAFDLPRPPPDLPARFRADTMVAATLQVYRQVLEEA